MRITKISVKGLFGMFDHEIPLNQESRITIVHGPNGVGKTVLLRMVHGLFTYEYEWLGSIPFELLGIFFDSGATLYVKTLAADSLPITDHDISFRDKRVGRLLLEYVDETGILAKPPFVVHWSNLANRIDDALRRQTLSHFVRLMHATGDTVWYNRKESNVSRAGEILDYFPKVRKKVIGKAPRWLSRLQEDICTNLIHIKRLSEYGFDVYEPTDPDAPLEPLDDFEKFYFAGLYSSAVQEIAENLRMGTDFIVAGGRRLYEAIINERFLFKSVEIGDLTGFRIRDNCGNGIDVSHLSSGEQQLLTLYFQLLYQIEPDTLVMIDEPELSMNIVWQRNFLKDLQRIIELRKFDVLIATHSPEVIYDKWDWTVALGEKAND